MLNTVIHYVVLKNLTAWQIYGEVVGNMIAYCLATSFSFFANSLWSFRSQITVKAFVRFIAVFVGGLVVSAAIASVMTAHEHSLLYIVIIGTVVLTPCNFAIHYYWTYKENAQTVPK
jgi:putative flippase GtrA